MWSCIQVAFRHGGRSWRGHLSRDSKSFRGSFSGFFEAHLGYLPPPSTLAKKYLNNFKCCYLIFIQSRWLEQRIDPSVHQRRGFGLLKGWQQCQSLQWQEVLQGMHWHLCHGNKVNVIPRYNDHLNSCYSSSGYIQILGTQIVWVNYQV